MPGDNGRLSVTASEWCHGIEVGAVSLKWVRRTAGGRLDARAVRHEGDPRRAAQELALEAVVSQGSRAVITGQATRALVELPYRTEAECTERALQFLGLQPDIVLSLGGENFVLYCLKRGQVRNILTPSKCAAGTGEFIGQQLDRMGLSLQEGLALAATGKRVKLSTRCSVYCKSDATHKLNKKECTPADIAHTLMDDLAEKVCKLVHVAQWPAREVVVSGGLGLNLLFVEHLRRRLPESHIVVPEQGPCLEAFGAALHAGDMGAGRRHGLAVVVPLNRMADLQAMPPLQAAAALLDYRVRDGVPAPIASGAEYILGVDAGSTTTKAVLMSVADGSIAASTYLRTHGNPVSAVKRCVASLREQIGETPIRIVQTATTGSGRGITAVFLGNAPDFNEIMAHGRAATEELPDVDTVFEMGGQDSKFISFQAGTPVDYAMNEGCSAGTGSFLEEAVGSDLGVPVEKIAEVAESSLRPISFGERCAAFINSESRSVLQQGYDRSDVIAGMVYSIAKNYLSRVVGVRRVGRTVLFQGGVALNRSVALAMATVLQRRVIVPPHPELMGCVGVCLLVRDRLLDGSLETRTYDLEELEAAEMAEESTFRCAGCETNCEIRMLTVRGSRIAYGGLCSKYERGRRRQKERRRGRHLIARRNEVLLDCLEHQTVDREKGTVGIPRALTTYNFLPFYGALLNELGYRVVLSGVSEQGTGQTRLSLCYPCEIAHGAVRDLLDRGVERIFLPHLVDGERPNGPLHSYMCGPSAIIPHLVAGAFPEGADKLLCPTIGLSRELRGASVKQLEGMVEQLGGDRRSAAPAFEKAWAHFQALQAQCCELGREALESAGTRPLVILCGRPYVVCSPEVNLGLPEIITDRGYDVVSCDMLPMEQRLQGRNVWHQTQLILNAVEFARARRGIYLVMVSCFSCGPDAIIYHAARERLGERVFCYLEIDSHTARAGFETRVEAFLDIIDENERQAAKASVRRDAPRPSRDRRRVEA